MAIPVYYTIFHALEEDTMEVFKDGGSGILAVSPDDGTSYKVVDRFSFDKYGRGFARVYDLSKVPADAPVKLTAVFNESARGETADTVIHTTAGEFLDSLSRYSRWSWLAYKPVYVSYDVLPDIVDTAIAADGFEILVAAVQEAGLEDALRGEGPFTVFAPTDDAFGDLLSALGATPEQLLADTDLADILLYHVVAGALDGDAVAAETHLETLLGKDVEITVVGEDIFVNGARVVLGNIEASNGIIHVINAVLLPPVLPGIVDVAKADDRFETLVAALEATGLDDALSGEGTFTVFAPTDDAFEALGIPPNELLANTNLANILLYHVTEGRVKAADAALLDRITTLLGEDVKVTLTGEDLFINDAKVILEDIKAENGIIHAIDAVLIPAEMPDIVDVAEGAGQFETLLYALELTGLDDVLRGDGPFTVFAPTDEAFGALPDWLLSYLIRNPDYLKQILLYHVVAGDLDSGEVLEQGRLKTVQGGTVRARAYEGEVYINRARVLAADVEAENGTIHVINRVLIPWFTY
jgi:transforming growth factor-beta-induced protein